MNKKRILSISVLGIVFLCAGFFYWHTQRQANYAKTREIFAPIYEYSGRLTPEEQKRFSELIDSIMGEFKPSGARKYRLPKRERLQLEVHNITLRRNNPELLLMGYGSLPAGTDVEPYIRYFSILALIAKTQLADLPTDSKRTILSHLETFEQRLTKNSVEIYLQEIKNTPFRPNQKLPRIRFGVANAPTGFGGQWIFEADGSFTWPEGAKRGVVQITDSYGNEYAVDLDAPADTAGMTEDTTELYAKIDRLFNLLTEAEFRKLSTLSKVDRSAELEKLFRSE